MGHLSLIVPLILTLAPASSSWELSSSIEACIETRIESCIESCIETGPASFSSVPTPARPAISPGKLGKQGKQGKRSKGGQGSAEAQAVAKLVEEIKSRRDPERLKLFETIAQRKSPESLEGLIEAVGSLQNPVNMKQGFRVFRHYQAIPELRPRAITFLEGRTEAGRAGVRRAAVRALAQFSLADDPELRKTLEGIVSKHKDPRCRSLALGPLLPGLVEDGSPQALGTILDNFHLPSTGKREVVFDSLAKFVGPKAETVFLGRLRDKKYPPLRKQLIIASMIEREGEAVDEALVAALKDPQPLVQYAAIDALNKRGFSEHAKQLGRLAKSKDAAVRRAALIALARIKGGDERWVKELMNLAGDKDSAKRQAAAAALAELHTVETIQALYLLLRDQDRAVRAEALYWVGSLRRKDSIPVLIDRVGGENAVLRQDVLSVLRLLTAQDHGNSPERWKRWWQVEGEEFKLPSLESAEAEERSRRQREGQGRTSTGFYGLEIISDRACFVLDVSGSMRSLMRGSGKTRMAAAREELSKALQAYADGRLFNVIFFASRVSAWQDELVTMNSKTRESVLEFVGSQVPTDSTAIYDALRVAFDDPRVDTIYLLSDGIPEGGTINDVQQILAEVLRWNSTRRLKIHCVSVGGRHPLLASLAQQTGGELRVVN